MSDCPNCGRDVKTHEMFSPPRCPVVRLKFPLSGEPAIVTYSRRDDEPLTVTELVLRQEDAAARRDYRVTDLTRDQ